MTPRTSAFFFENNFRIITEQLYHKSRNFYPHYLQHFNVLRATLWCLIDSPPPRLLIFGIFSTQDILIPTPPAIIFSKIFQSRQFSFKNNHFFLCKKQNFVFKVCVFSLSFAIQYQSDEHLSKSQCRLYEDVYIYYIFFFSLSFTSSFCNI